MELIKVDLSQAQQYAQEIPELMYATGPVSYDYHFRSRTLFDGLVRRSWLTDGTLFGADAATLAVEDGELLGIGIFFRGPEYRKRIAALDVLWPEILASGECDEDGLQGLLQRSEHAHWLNPVIHSNVFYVHALSVKPESRGKQIGVQLLNSAMQAGREYGCTALQLDVLSDNPAVHFYSSMGLELLVESRAPKPEAFGVPPEWRMGIAL
jgi:ribosomal protein S18 acetylase RimI-like enzyme